MTLPAQSQRKLVYLRGAQAEVICDRSVGMALWRHYVMPVVRDLAYFVQGDTGKGPGVLLLHSIWGLTPSVKRLCDGLADRGFTVLAPDINFGEFPATEQEGIDHLGEASPDRLASLVLTSARLVAEQSTPGPIGVVGFGMGGSLGLWASVRLADLIGAVVSFYGTQQIDFAGSKSSYLVHFAEEDDYITDDEAVFMEATMGLESLPVEVIAYPGTRHGFCEPDSQSFDRGAFDRAWARTIEFLETLLNP